MYLRKPKEDSGFLQLVYSMFDVVKVGEKKKNIQASLPIWNIDSVLVLITLIYSN